MVAIWLMARMRASSPASSASGTRSVLLRMMRSAYASCSRASLGASLWSPSSRWRVTCLASTTVTTPSRRTMGLMSWSVKVRMMGAGLASPVVSIMMWSKSLRRFSSRSKIMSMRSPRTVQQRQPLLSIMMVSSVFSATETSLLSMSISPNSFSMMATRRPWSLVSRLFSVVVLPLPRKPVSTVMGTRLSTLGGGGLWLVAEEEAARRAGAPLRGASGRPARRSWRAAAAVVVVGGRAIRATRDTRAGSAPAAGRPRRPAGLAVTHVGCMAPLRRRGLGECKRGADALAEGRTAGGEVVRE
mmetsp:Transcript_44518/g.112636  ORF Transcript_44518/g.112636 Transcript_44518/m.112636 type:complete len:301 (-) Transcript_44518:39-941(-)